MTKTQCEDENVRGPGFRPLEEDTPEGCQVEVTLKIAGVHWYYAHASHAAELTAGYHNTERNNGYRQIVEMCARNGVTLTLTCVEMRDQDHPPDAFCSPKRLIRLVLGPPSPHDFPISVCPYEGVPAWYRKEQD
jgi:Glycosyl hydrolase family 14